MLAFRNDRFAPSGTDGSNPLSSSGESTANLPRTAVGAVMLLAGKEAWPIDIIASELSSARPSAAPLYRSRRHRYRKTSRARVDDVTVRRTLRLNPVLVNGQRGKRDENSSNLHQCSDDRDVPCGG